jgi:hypothetical protein
MDALILSLTQDQHQKYLSLLKEDDITLNFEIESQSFENRFEESIKLIKEKMILSCEKINNFAKRESFFSNDLKKEEIDALIPKYYENISTISGLRKNLYALSIEISNEILSVEGQRAKILQKYADFLPYKAALGKNKKYANEIIKIDNEFSFEISKIAAHKNTLSHALSKISIICDELVPTFFQNSSQAADSPKFKNFNDNTFFISLSSFIEQMKNV